MKSKVSIKKRPDKAIAKLEKLSASIGGDFGVLVGLPKDSQPYPDGTPVQLVALVHEFGSDTMGIPERSFLRSAIVEGRRKYKAMMKRLAVSIIRGKVTTEKAMAMLGLQASSDVKDKIVEIKEPANTEGVIAKKGSSNPLIDTSHMKNSITWANKNAD